MGKDTNTTKPSYVLLFASMLGFLVGLALLVYGWPQPCGAFVPYCSESYSLVIFGIVIMAVSVRLMTYSIRKVPTSVQHHQNSIVNVEKSQDK
jgi:hypothetical protein